MRDQENFAKPPQFAQTGWSVQSPIIRDLTKPPRPLQLRMLRTIFLDVASTPPRLRRGVGVGFDLIHTFYRPATLCKAPFRTKNEK